MVSHRSLTESVREFVFERVDVDLFGVAPVKRFESGPMGARPTDYLPDATCVLVLAAKMPDTIIEVAGHYEEPGKTLGPYMWYGYVTLNWILSSAASRLTRLLEVKGFKGLPFPPTGVLYKFGSMADFSHRHAAVAAGLGDFGFSGLVLTPEFGPRQRFVSIVTNAPLEASPIYNGQKLCRPDACEYACIKACPTKALSGRVSLTMNGRTFEYAKVHRVKCQWWFDQRGFHRTKFLMPSDPTEEDLQEAVRSTRLHPFDIALSQHAFLPRCGACIFSCPSPHFSDVKLKRVFK